MIRRNDLRSLSISLVLHGTAILLLFLGGVPGHEDYGPYFSDLGPKHTDVIPKATEVELVEVVPKNAEGDVPVQAQPELPKEAVTQCEDNSWYGGIGIQQNHRTNEIQVVFPGYPAELSGLREADIIETQSEPDIRGEPGTTIKLQVYRPSTQERFLVEVTRDKICTFGRI